MSQADVERFTRDLQSDEQLRNEVKSGASGLTSIVEIAKRRGYDVTIDKVKQFMRSQTPKELSDEHLEAMAGGAGDPPSAIAVSLIQTMTQSSGSIVVVTEVNTNTNTSTSASASGPIAVALVA